MKLADAHDYIIIIIDGNLVIIKAIRIYTSSFKNQECFMPPLGTVFKGHTHAFCRAISAPAVEPFEL